MLSRIKSGLQRGTHQSLKIRAVQAHLSLALICDRMDWQCDKAFIHLSNGDSGVPGHGHMHCLLCQQGTKLTVLGIRRHGSDHVCGIDVLHRDGYGILLAVACDLVFHEDADICQFLVSASIRSTITLDDGVTTALCHDNHGPLLSPHDGGDVLQQLVQRDVHLRNAADIDVSRRKRGPQGNPPAVATHELHKAHAICIGGRLDISGVDCSFRFCTCCVKAKAAVDDLNVIVNRLRNANDSAFMPQLCHLNESGLCTSMCAITTQNKQLPNVAALQDFRNL
mmetsp:Transcript_89867/g.169354  ORF Transcript_89867/g.169354 Transcript_89867/m.169354 type:complete len:281 (-) Transcript_89867:4161-5003(-)